MRHYRNILYVSHGTADETEGLRQALSLARNNEAPLKVILLIPALPKQFADHQSKYEAGLVSQMKVSIEQTSQALKLDTSLLKMTIEVLNEKAAVNAVIKQVLQHGFDLVIKEADQSDEQKRYQARDMDLLRKCPAAVWLCRPISKSRDKMQIAVAIDPEVANEADEKLSIRLLQLARSLADTCSGELHILSCWNFPLESELRHNVFIKVSEDEIERMVEEEREAHLQKLDRLLALARLQGSNHIHHLRGNPDKLIPKFARDQEVNVMVMGTVARTGIKGVMIGNTAENIIQKLPSSLLALKPESFESPVKL